MVNFNKNIEILLFYKNYKIIKFKWNKISNKKIFGGRNEVSFYYNQNRERSHWIPKN